MTKSILSTLMMGAALTLTACGGTSAPDTKEAATEKMADKAETMVKETMAKTVTLSDVVAHPRRAEESAVDKFRNPAETLAFFEVAPGKHVAEVWPGYYSSVLAPYLKENGGKYTAVLYPESFGERAMNRVKAFKEKYSDTEAYGTVSYGAFGKGHGAMMTPGSADIVISRRNVHNWMRGSYDQEAFNEFFAALKPGGILGIVEHRLPETMEQDPRGATGYVQESYMKDMAIRAGFEFVDSSEINANPKDTADHPYGVWTLPPRSKTPDEDSPEAADFDADLYKNIGESDRATLKFRKPL